MELEYFISNQQISQVRYTHYVDIQYECDLFHSSFILPPFRGYEMIFLLLLFVFPHFSTLGCEFGDLPRSWSQAIY